MLLFPVAAALPPTPPKSLWDVQHDGFVTSDCKPWVTADVPVFPFPIHGGCRATDIYPGDGSEFQVVVLATMGDWLFHHTSRSEQGGGGPPYHRQTWRAVDLKTGSKIDPGSWLDEASLVRAIVADPWIAKFRDVPEAATTWTRLEQLGDLQGVEAGIAVPYRYDPKRHTFEVRYGFLAAERLCGLCPGNVTQLGLEVEGRAGFVVDPASMFMAADTRTPGKAPFTRGATFGMSAHTTTTTAIE